MMRPGKAPSASRRDSVGFLLLVRLPATEDPWIRIETRRPAGLRTSTHALIDQLYGAIPVVPIYDACLPNRKVDNDRAALPLSLPLNEPLSRQVASSWRADKSE
jgi:hypothetical protein